MVKLGSKKPNKLHLGMKVVLYNTDKTSNILKWYPCWKLEDKIVSRTQVVIVV